MDITNVNHEFQVFECTACFALLPYLAAKHNCPVKEDDKGSEDEINLMYQFLSDLDKAKKNPTITVRYFYAN